MRGVPKKGPPLRHHPIKSRWTRGMRDYLCHPLWGRDEQRVRYYVKQITVCVYWFVQLQSQRSQLSHTFRNFRSADTACGTTWEASVNEYISRKRKDGDWRGGGKLKWQQDKKWGNKEREQGLTKCLSCSTMVGTHPGHPLNRVTGLWPIEHWQLIQ